MNYGSRGMKMLNLIKNPQESEGGRKEVDTNPTLLDISINLNDSLARNCPEIVFWSESASNESKENHQIGSPSTPDSTRPSEETEPMHPDGCGKQMTVHEKKTTIQPLLSSESDCSPASSLNINGNVAPDKVPEHFFINTNVTYLVSSPQKILDNVLSNISSTPDLSLVESLPIEPLFVNSSTLNQEINLFNLNLDDTSMLCEEPNVLIEFTEESIDVHTTLDDTVEIIQNAHTSLGDVDIIIPDTNGNSGDDLTHYHNEPMTNNVPESESDGEDDYRPDDDSINENKKKRPRKRHADPEQWERSIRKKLRMSGKSYVSAKGKTMPEKLFEVIDNCTCRFKCSDNISVDQQQSLFKEFWSIGDSCRQKNYITSLVVEEPVQRRRKRNNAITGKEKQTSRAYHLPDNDKKKHRVCQSFFCKMFQISKQIIIVALKKTSSSGVFLGDDGRKGRPAPNATKPEEIEHVKRHIDSFPRMESHYCRKDSKKLYLSPELNVAELYRLYVNDYCKTENITPVKDGVFRSVFKSYNPPLTTFIPKKDQCSKCNQYRDSEDKTKFGEEYKTHVRRKTEAMDMKRKDMCINEKNQVTATFDLQAVLMVPFAGDCQIYYKRKLSVYNFTILDSNSNGFCFLWDETNGMKGSSEIGTGLVNYMQNLPAHVNHVTTYSDTCGGQNRNQFVATAMLYVVNKTNIDTIDMKFMEPGHTYLEADSMHSTIERARKHKKVYSTEEWALLIQMSRKKPKPYDVKIQKFGDIYDLGKIGKTVMHNRTINTKGETINWLKIKWMRFEKSRPFVIQYKCELQDEISYEELDVRANSNEDLSWNMIDLTPKYTTHLPISKAKKKDLLCLLNTGVIPEAYNQFFSKLPVSEKAQDVVPYIQEDEGDEGLDLTHKKGKGRNKVKPKTKEIEEKIKKRTAKVVKEVKVEFLKEDKRKNYKKEANKNAKKK